MLVVLYQFALPPVERFNWQKVSTGGQTSLHEQPPDPTGLLTIRAHRVNQNHAWFAHRLFTLAATKSPPSSSAKKVPLRMAPNLMDRGA